MLSMLKLLTIISLLSISFSTNLFAKTFEEKLIKFEKQRVARNPRIKINEVKLFFKKDLKQDGWVGYVFDIALEAKGKKINVKDMLFSNRKMIAPDLINIKNNISFKRLMYPKLDSKYYDKKFLIAGDASAKHKMVVFSDPLCPNCVNTIPELIRDVKKNPKKIALYYIHMPLSMHPTAKTLVKASIFAHKKGIKNVDYKVYTAEFEKDFDAYKEKDNKKVLAIFNKKLKTNFTMKQINSKEIKDELKYGLKLSDDALVQGTPTIFFDGEIDPMRNKYLKYIK